jgi:hypothetical protein
LAELSLKAMHVHRETAMLLCESLEPLVPQGNKGHPSRFNGLLHVDMRQGKHRNPSGWLCHQAVISKRRKAGEGREKTRFSRLTTSPPAPAAPSSVILIRTTPVTLPPTV